MVELDDCGKEIPCTFDGYNNYTIKKKVIMVIKTPRGTLSLFGHEPTKDMKWNELYQTVYTFPKQRQQVRAIKAFMKEHRNDKAKAETKNSTTTSR